MKQRSLARIALTSLLVAALGVPSFAKTPAQGPVYGKLAKLEKTLKNYEKMAAKGGFVKVPEGPTLSEGDSGERVKTLRKRLAQTQKIKKRSSTFDAELTKAIERFQRLHGIEVDGLVGPGTLEALNAPIEERIGEMRHSLKLQREFATKAEGTFILVNVPAYHLKLVEGGKETMSMRVIVGTDDWASKPMDEQIEYLEINPDWDVPATIVAADLAPKVAENPNYLAENNFVIFDTWGPDAKTMDPSTIDWTAVDDDFPHHIRQLPGPENPLGQIKFMMPNEEMIYLHGTPHDQLFDNDMRAISHGCIRVEEPLELASKVMAATQDWDRTKIKTAIDSLEQQRVDLTQPFPVYVVYWPAWVGEDGEVYTTQDIYDRIDTEGEVVAKDEASS